LEAETGELKYEASLGKKLRRLCLKEQARVWWYMSVIPAIQEAEVGGLEFEADLGKSLKCYLKK
jgi:hypothetical protein